MPRTGDVCLATAVTDSFVPGAVAMLGSFRAHHPGFDGDVVVLHDGLSEVSRKILATVGGHVRFEPVRPELTDRFARLEEAYPHRVCRPANVHCIDAFRLDGYRKVLYYDSDVLFQGPVDELFGAEEALLCCGDRFHLTGVGRDPETLEPLEPGAADAGRPVREGTFNCGFLLIDASCAGERVYAELLARMAPEAWGSVVLLDDQNLLNRYFAKRQTLVSWTYNYLVPHAAAIRARTGLDAAGAKVLHFKGPVKPWAPDAMLRWVRGEAESVYRPAAAPFRRWYDAYVDVLARTHLRTAHGIPPHRTTDVQGDGGTASGSRRPGSGAITECLNIIPHSGLGRAEAQAPAGQSLLDRICRLRRPKPSARRSQRPSNRLRQVDFDAPQPEIDPCQRQFGHHDASEIPKAIALQAPGPPRVRT